jgi:hypothetical protein
MRRNEASQRIAAEIASEKAQALGRAGERLDAALAHSAGRRLPRA